MPTNFFLNKKKYLNNLKNFENFLIKIKFDLKFFKKFFKQDLTRYIKKRKTIKFKHNPEQRFILEKIF